MIINKAFFKIITKVPGQEVKLKSEYMQYCYKVDPHKHFIPDPYERLLLDAISGNHTFFNKAEGWEIFYFETLFHL